MDWETVYPNGSTKALTFSYDDGQIHDRKLVELFNRYGMKGTFHLNSGTLDTKGFLSSREIPTLFEGHEIACHGVRHEWLTQLSPDRLAGEILEDRRALEQIAAYPVRGFSYAFGAYSAEAADALRMLGIEYARTTKQTGAAGKFAVPTEPLFWHPTAHHNDGIATLAELFLAAPSFRKLPLLYIWGHSYEFDRDNNWDVIEGFCKVFSGRPDVWRATNLDYIRYLSAIRRLICSVDGHILYNPSGLSVWLRIQQDLTELRPGETITL